MRRYIQKLEFYITNVCNLACPECNRFNNHDFRGHQRWQDYEHDYAQWARIIDVNGLVILGGEPLLNPSICDWVMGLNRCFGREVQILTNGTRLNKTPGLYEALASYKGPLHNSLGIHVHNSNDIEQTVEEVEKFLRGRVRTYHKMQVPHLRSVRQTLSLDKKPTDDFARTAPAFKANYTWLDENNVVVRLWISNNFSNSSIRVLPPRQVDGKWQAGGFGVYNNDPVAAHQVCGFVQWKNYHMIRGRLYKCGPSVLMADFDKQNPLDISAGDREILHSYRGLSAWDDADTIDDFLQHIDDVIPQCKFCPVEDQMRNTTIFAVSKKSNSTSIFN